MPFSRENRHLTLSLVLIVTGCFIIAIGAQAYVAIRDNAQRDARDRAYAECLTEFADDLVATIERRTEAGIRLDEAEEAKARALDRLLRITELARRTPPKATAKEFDAALDARVAAQRRYDRVLAQVEEVREENTYTSPRVECPR